MFERQQNDHNGQSNYHDVYLNNDFPYKSGRIHREDDIIFTIPASKAIIVILLCIYFYRFTGDHSWSRVGQS